MTEWRRVKIADLCSRTTSGGTPSRRRPDFYCPPPGGIPWVKSQELLETWVNRTSEHITESGLKGSSAKLLPPGTVLLAMYGGPGKLGILGVEATVNQAICALITDPAVTDPRFLFYALTHARSDLVQLAHGAAQQNLSQQLIRAFELSVPEIHTQRGIAAVLGSLDDLIYNYRRRADVLEEMAQAIFREWFVQYRYPGYRDRALVESPLGLIPEAWTVAAPAAWGTIEVGGDWGEDEPGSGRWIQAACLRGTDLPRLRKGDCSTVKLRWVKEASLLKRELTDRDVVVEGSGECGRALSYDERLPALIGAPALYSNFCKRLRCDSSAYATFTARTFNTMVEQGTMAAFKTGTAIPNLNFTALVEQHRIALPPRDLLSAFADRVRPLEQFALSGAVARLQALRDLLLPKLLSGEIEVTDLDLDAVTELATS